MRTTRWAVLGPGAISGDFVTGLRSARHGVLHAVGSSSPERAAVFAAAHGADVSGTYDDVLARDDVDAVYIGTVHTTHQGLAVRALEAGKAVLCEKPASPTVSEVERILAVAEREQRVFVEAFKNRFGPLASMLREVLAGGDLGAPERVEAAFGFAAASREGRLFDPALAGGAILDVGCYPVSLVVDVARAGGMPRPGDVRLVAASGTVVGGVDADASGVFDLGGMTAALETSIVRDLPGSAVIRCADGVIELPDAWGGRAESATTLVLRARGGDRVIEVERVQPMAAEADAVSLALAEGRLEAPEMPWADTRAIAAALTDWRAAVLR